MLIGLILAAVVVQTAKGYPPESMALGIIIGGCWIMVQTRLKQIEENPMGAVLDPTRDQRTNDSQPRECAASDCDREARCAILTKRPNRESVVSSIYFDDRTAPRSALPYCKAHGTEIINGSISLLVDNDA